jgi:predicted metal-dependent RNase
MIWEATAIHAAYPEYLNYQLRNDIFHMGENPFLSKIFHRVDSGEMRDKILNDPDPCIVIGTAGMMNGGPIMEYFKQWAPEAKNTLLFVGYQAEGTMGRRFQNGMKELQLGMGKDQKIIKINLNIETCDGFSGHSDRRQLMNYIYDMRPQPEMILIGHGEAEKCIQLSSSLHKQYGMETRALMNLETVRFK